MQEPDRLVVSRSSVEGLLDGGRKSARVGVRDQLEGRLLSGDHVETGVDDTQHVQHLGDKVNSARFLHLAGQAKCDDDCELVIRSNALQEEADRGIEFGSARGRKILRDGFDDLVVRLGGDVLLLRHESTCRALEPCVRLLEL